MRDESEVTTALALVAAGLNDCEVSRRTGIPRPTIRDWRSGRVPRRTGPLRRCDVCADRALRFPEADYAYLLGMYLGDGCISPGPRTFRMRITLDLAYPMIIESCAAALEAIRPAKRTWIGVSRTSRCAEVSMCWNHWPCLFPQHGPGRKHERPIFLADWQEEIVGRERKALIRGLIHSDGCRVVANDRGVASLRYHFSNRSEDIKAIYCESLDALGIHWTRPCSKQIAVYRKADTARLDEFVGPKR
jgi:hypothetical protein